MNTHKLTHSINSEEYEYVLILLKLDKRSIYINIGTDLKRSLTLN